MPSTAQGSAMRNLLFITCFALGCSAAENGPSTTADAATDTAEKTESDTGAASDTATSADTPAVEGASFDDVFTTVLNTSCSNGYCHGSVAGGWSVKEDKDQTYAQLVGPDSSQCSGLKRVTAGDPEKSALYLKLRGGFAGICTGNKMPPSGGIVTAAQLETVRSWIAAGAKR
jgi:hypothetical protein